MSEAGVKLGRLKSLGLSTLEEVSLYLPTAIKDNRNVLTSLDARLVIPNQEVVVSGRMNSVPQTTFTNKRPRTKFVITDGQFSCTFSMFGDNRNIVKQYPVNKPITVRGIATFIGNAFYQNGRENPVIRAKRCRGDESVKI
jgi:RecG-like helicase